MATQIFQELERLLQMLPDLPEDARRNLIELLCETGLKIIARMIEAVGDAQHPVDMAVAMIHVALKTGHSDILNQMLAKVDVTWPYEVVMAFWAATAVAADQLPARDLMWERFESRALPRC